VSFLKKPVENNILLKKVQVNHREYTLEKLYLKADGFFGYISHNPFNFHLKKTLRYYEYAKRI